MTKVKDRFSIEAARSMAPAVLRSVIRERAHHLLEIPLQTHTTLRKKLAVHRMRVVSDLLDVWRERGFSTEVDDLVWVSELLRQVQAPGSDARKLSEDDSDQSVPEVEVELARQLIIGRRSVRAWEDRRVPRQMLEEIVRAGQWAPCACNLQTLRVLILDDPERAAAVRLEVSGAPAQLIICQDVRPYEFYGSGIPIHNRWLDCGAAVQNMLLMAHALGLGAVWLTIREQQASSIRDVFGIPDHMAVMCCISVGWPSVLPQAPGRMELDQVIIDPP